MRMHRWVILIISCLFVFSCGGENRVKEMSVENMAAWPGDAVFLGGSDKEIGRVTSVEESGSIITVGIEFHPPVQMTFSSVRRNEKGVCLVPGMAASKQERGKLMLNVEYNDKIPLTSVIPGKLLELIREDTCFFMAEVSALGGNRLYILDSAGRVSGLYTEIPPADGFFEGEPEFLFQSQADAFEGFKTYMKNFAGEKKRSFVNTPSDLDVQGGTVLYVYMKDGEDFRGFRFAPQAPGREELIGFFDKLAVE